MMATVDVQHLGKGRHRAGPYDKGKAKGTGSSGGARSSGSGTHQLPDDVGRTGLNGSRPDSPPRNDTDPPGKGNGAADDGIILCSDK